MPAIEECLGSESDAEEFEDAQELPSAPEPEPAPEPAPEPEPAAEGSGAATPAQDSEASEPIPEISAEEAEAVLAEATSAKEKGNEQFKAGKWSWACDHYSEALDISASGRGHSSVDAARAVFFSNRAMARLKMELYEAAAADCTESLKLVPDNLKTLLRRTKAYEEAEKLVDAVEDMKKVVEIAPSATNRANLARLDKAQKEQFERQKEEMLGTLKDFGNTILGKFGLSTDNFQMQQQEGGGYSVNFVQNPGGQQ